MAPYLSSKRARDEASDKSPAHATPPKRARVTPASKAAAPKTSATKPKQNLSESLDSSVGGVQTVAHRRQLRREESENDSDSSNDGSDEDSDDFEDVPRITAGHRHKTATVQNVQDAGDESGESDESDEMEFEDVHHSTHSHHHRHRHHHHSDEPEVETPIGDISVELPTPGTNPAEVNGLAFSDARGVVGKKGPSKIEREIRQNTHCMHVQFLMFHNTIRNAWCQDKIVQDTLVKQLPQALQKEVTRWRKSLGGAKSKPADLTNAPVRPSRKEGKRKGKMPVRSKKDEDEDRALLDMIPTRNEYDDRALRDRMRDWGAEAEPLEEGEPDLSYGDPTVRLLRFLAAYWKKRFLISAPSLHKRGYLGLKDLEVEVKAWAQEPADAERFGERIQSREDFRQAAKKYEGSRDVGAQLFTSLLRGLGLEARLVVSLQPAGFGFGKVEDGEPYKKKAPIAKAKEKDHAAFTPGALKRGTIDMKKNVRQLKQTSKTNGTPTRTSGRGATNTAPINLDTSSSDELSDAPSDLLSEASIVDVTPSRKPTKAYDAPPMPTYWTEVLSPLTQSYIPVVCLPQPLIANSPELLAIFTPSGKAVEKAKQVLAYVVAHNSDGTAKDVTVRYLKKKQWPGKTRGVRVQKEKLPIYNKRGKVKKWIEWDWFHEVMSGYTKDPRLRSAAEKKEDEMDLVPIDPPKKEDDASGGKGNVGGKPESLQAYKNSAEYVLERHLRREEALLPDSKPVRHFTTGKGDDIKHEPVFRRADVVTGLTVESWHKQGRAVNEGEQPIKMVPIRAVTLIRKREVEDAQRETGEKPMQGLYSKDQTDWIIPDPIGPDRRIPKNAFGNIDVYVPSMVPAGAVHVRLKGTAKLCKKLEIDFSEAVTGFEFGKQRAVPVITGVVVAAEHEGIVRDAWRAEQERVKERERIKKQAACLAMWKKFLMSLKVLERMQGEYGHIEKGEEDEVNPWMNKRAREEARKRRKEGLVGNALKQDGGPLDDHDEEIRDDGTLLGPDEGGGGFIPEGMEVEEVRPAQRATAHLDDEEESGGGFLLDEDEEAMSLTSPGKQYTNGSARAPTSSPAKIDVKPTVHPPSSKRGKNGKGTTSKKGGLSKRVADAREFEGNGDEAMTDDGLLKGSEHQVSAPEGEEPSPAPRPRSSRKQTAAKPVTKSGTRATPKRRAAKGVRSRYFESDATVTD